MTWKQGGKAFEYRKDNKSYRFDIAEGKPKEAPPTADEPAPPATGRRGRRGGGGVERGRQAASATSPDGTLKAFCKDRNLWISDRKGVIEMAVTTDGSEKDRIKNGTASWVYGEELGPDYRDLVVARQQEGRLLPVRREQGARLLPRSSTRPSLQSTIDIEPYPKAGAPNPVVDIYIYDLETKKTTKLDVRDGKPFDGCRRRPLRLPRRVVARRQGATLQPDQPPPEHHGIRRGRPGRPASAA